MESEVRGGGGGETLCVLGCRIIRLRLATRNIDHVICMPLQMLEEVDLIYRRQEAGGVSDSLSSVQDPHGRIQVQNQRCVHEYYQLYPRIRLQNVMIFWEIASEFGC